jgi:UDPglucose--hexose-1-phosphate uridylyltransferase
MVGDMAFRDLEYATLLWHMKYDIIHAHLVLPYKRHIPSILDLTPEEKVAFAQIISSLTKRYDNLFQCSFAYSMGIHQRPIPPKNVVIDSSLQSAVHASDQDEDIAHLHLHFTPPLLRSASVRKFLVGCVWFSLEYPS